MSGEPLDEAILERLNAARGPIVLALSGGGDSAALLHLLVDACGASRLAAVIIDHALRAGSDEDARRAAGFAEARGAMAEIVTLAWPEAATRNQANARELRYAALCAAARRRGANVIALGHTADDQAETVLIRAQAGSGWRGLAGMAAWAPAPLWPEGRGIHVARPLIAARRADLRALLRARGAEWIEDPANANSAFTRVRVRKELAALEQSGLNPARLSSLAAKLRPLAARVDADAGSLIARAVRVMDDDIVLDRGAWRGGDEVRVRALGVLIAAAAGAVREPAGEALARLDAGLRNDAFRGASLGGARLALRKGALHIGRDPGALRGRAGVAPAAPVPLEPLIETIWDRRLALIAQVRGWSVRAGARGPELRRGAEALALSDAVRAGLVNASWLLATHVAHRLDVEILAVPGLSPP